MKLEFVVYGSPLAQPRARSRAFIAGYTNGKPNIQVRAYESQTVKDKNSGLRKVNPVYEWKQAIRAAALKALGCSTEDDLDTSRLWDGPIAMNLTIFFPRPKRLMRTKDPDGPILHISKPDRDNCEKAILDSLKGIVFVDDCQICDGPVRKFYTEKNGKPRAHVVLEGITDGQRNL